MRRLVGFFVCLYSMRQTIRLWRIPEGQPQGVAPTDCFNDGKNDERKKNIYNYDYNDGDGLNDFYLRPFFASGLGCRKRHRGYFDR